MRDEVNWSYLLMSHLLTSPGTERMTHGTNANGTDSLTAMVTVRDVLSWTWSGNDGGSCVDSITYDVIRSRTTYRRATDALRDYQRPRRDGRPDHHENRSADVDPIADSAIHTDADPDATIQECESDE